MDEYTECRIVECASGSLFWGEGGRGSSAVLSKVRTTSSYAGPSSEGPTGVKTGGGLDVRSVLGERGGSSGGTSTVRVVPLGNGGTIVSSSTSFPTTRNADLCLRRVKILSDLLKVDDNDSDVRSSNLELDEAVPSESPVRLRSCEHSEASSQGLFNVLCASNIASSHISNPSVSNFLGGGSE